MDLTPGFVERWREHRELAYMDHVAEVFGEVTTDEMWLGGAQRRARAMEAQATLKLSGFKVGELDWVESVIDGSVVDPGDADITALNNYAAAHDLAVAAARQKAAVTPAMLDDLHARLAGSDAAYPGTDAALTELCDWLASPPNLHRVVIAAIANVELLRMRRWQDGNARLARLALLLLLYRDGYSYLELFAPSLAWRDPRHLPERPAEELPPEQAETDAAVEHVVHDVARGVRDMVSWVRSDEFPGTIPEMLWGFPLQP